jgi:hypothetical protein
MERYNYNSGIAASRTLKRSKLPIENPQEFRNSLNSSVKTVV